MSSQQPPAAYSEVIAFLGGGNMARALIAGLVRRGTPAERIRVGEPRLDCREALVRDFAVQVFPQNAEALRGADCVVLAVKPQDAAVALQSLGALPAPRLLLSIAAGLPIARLAHACRPDTAVVRAMPNRPALVGAGVTALYAHAGLDAGARDSAERLAAAAGRSVWLRTEAEMDVVTALSGSGPAYFLLLAEELARAATALGLSAETAALLASETLYGTGLLAHQSAGERPQLQTLAAERTAVTSPGGTTEAALRVLQGGGFASLLAQALQAAASRSAELARSQPLT